MSALSCGSGWWTAPSRDCGGRAVRSAMEHADRLALSGPEPPQQIGGGLAAIGGGSAQIVERIVIACERKRGRLDCRLAPGPAGQRGLATGRAGGNGRHAAEGDSGL